MPLREPTSFSPFAVTAIDDLERPLVGVEQRLGEAVAAVGGGAGVHLDEAAEDRARGGARSLARDDARARAAMRSRSSARAAARHERREPRRGRREPRAGRKVVALATRARVSHARLRAQQIETRRDLASLLRDGAAVEHELVASQAPASSSTVGVGPQRVERDRNRADGRHVQARVGLAPILDECEVRAGACARAWRHGRA